MRSLKGKVFRNEVKCLGVLFVFWVNLLNLLPFRQQPPGKGVLGGEFVEHAEHHNGEDQLEAEDCLRLVYQVKNRIKISESRMIPNSRLTIVKVEKDK